MITQPWPVADASVLGPVPEHEDLRKVMRDILDSHATHEQVRRAADSSRGWSDELWTLLNEEMDVGAIAVPEDRGGLGFGIGVLGVVLEEGGRALLPEPLLLSAVLGVRAVLAAPAGSVPDDVIRDVVAGRLIVTVALEPHADTDLVAVATDSSPARVSGSIGRVVLGETTDLVVVAVGPAGSRALHLVDLRGGVCTRRAHDVLDLTRRQARLDLDGAPAHLIAEPEWADAVLTELATLRRVSLAAEHVGMIEAMLDMTRTYVGQREQFGRPLASFQVIKHRLADVLVDLERSRSAARYAAAAFDQDPVTADLPAAVAAAVCTDAVIRVAHDIVQLHGGIGFTWEHPAHFYLRRALGDEASFGSAGSHRALVAALLGI